MNKHTFFLFLAIIITSCSNAQGNSDIPLPPASLSISPRSFKAWITESGKSVELSPYGIHRELHHLLGEGLRQ